MWNVRNLGELRRRAHAAQALRRVPDIDLRSLQVRGSARVRGYVAGSLQAEDRIRTISERSRDLLRQRVEPGARRPRPSRRWCSSFLVLVGSRSLIFGRVPVIGQLPGWPGVGELLETFTSAWRYTDLGSASAGTGAARGVLAARHARCSARPGSPARSSWSARSRSGCSARGASAVASPVRAARRSSPRWRTGSTRCRGTRSRPAASARWCCTRSRRSSSRACLRRRRVSPRRRAAALVARGHRDRRAGRADHRRVAARDPAADLCVAVALTLAQPIARGAGELRALWRATVVAHRHRPRAAVAVAARVPARRGPAGGARVRVPLDFDFSEVLRFQTGPNGAGAVGMGHRRRRVARARARLGSAPRLGDPGLGARARVVRVRLGAVPLLLRRPDAGRRGAAGARPRSGSRSRSDSASRRSSRTSASSTSGGARSPRSAARSRWRSRSSRSRSTRSTVAGTCRRRDWNAEPVLDALRGGERAVPRARGSATPTVLPVDPVVHGDVGYGVTNDGPGDARTALPPPAGGSSARLGDVVDLLRERRSNRIGALLGPMGVRYLAVPQRPDPGHRAHRPGARVACSSRSATSSIWSGSRDRPGWSCTRTARGSRARRYCPPSRVTDGDADPVRTGRRRAAARGRCATASRCPPGAILWSQSYDGSWSASSNGGSLPHRRVFGWANGYTLDRAGPGLVRVRQPVAALSRGADRARRSSSARSCSGGAARASGGRSGTGPSTRSTS